MKKFLSLALALIMVMSLVTVGAGAAFTDAENITNVEAVEVMSALGILSGSNGAFDPTGTLTRGAAAKIIAYMLEGTAKADAIAAAGLTEAPFSDVPTTSATAPFIAYCAEQGIVGGYDDGTFKRSNPVSGNAFVKMVLVALGVTDIDFTAKGWQIDAIARAEEMGLLEGISDDVVYSANLTRENAAQIAFNGMQYVPEGNKYWYVGDVKFETATDAAVYAALTAANDAPEQKADLTKSLAGKNYKLAVATIIISSNQKTVVGQKTTKATNGTGGKEFSVETGLDLVGHKVNIYFKDADADGIYDAKEVVYAVVDLSTEIVVAKKAEELTAEEVEALLGIEPTTAASQNATVDVENYVVTGGNANPIKYASEEYTLEAGTYIVSDEKLVGYKTVDSYVDTFAVSLTDVDDGYYTVKDGSNADVVIVAEDEDDCKDYDLSDIDWAGMVDEDDRSATAVYVVTKIGNGYSLAEVETVVGKVAKIGTKITVGETEYSKSAETLTAEIAALEATAIATDPNFEDEYTFYLDQDGKIFAWASNEEGATTTDPSLIIPVYVYTKTSEVKEVKDEYGKVTNASKAGKFYSIWVQAIDMNGEIVNLQVGNTTKYTDASAIDTAVTAYKTSENYPADLNKFATYTTTEIDDEAISAITKVTSGTTKGHDYVTAGISSTAKKLTVGVKDYYLNDDYKVIYLTGTGADVKVTIKDGSYDQIVAGSFAYGEKEEDATAYELKYVLVNNTVSTSVAGEDLVFVNGTFGTGTKVPYTDADGEIATGYEQTVYINGEKTTIITTGTQSSVVTGAGFYTYEVDELGLYTLKALTNAEAESVALNVQIDSIYKGMISDAATSLVDVDVTGATLVNLVSKDDANYSKIPTDPAKLAATETIYIVLNEDGDAAELIYITASSRT